MIRFIVVIILTVITVALFAGCNSMNNNNEQSSITSIESELSEPVTREELADRAIELERNLMEFPDDEKSSKWYSTYMEYVTEYYGDYSNGAIDFSSGQLLESVGQEYEQLAKEHSNTFVGQLAEQFTTILRDNQYVVFQYPMNNMTPAVDDFLDSVPVRIEQHFTAPSLNVDSRVTVTSMKLEEKPGNYEISLEYPQIKVESNDGVLNAVNKAVEEHALSLWDEGNSELNRIIAMLDSKFTAYNVTYKVTYDQDNKLSFYYEIFTFISESRGSWSRIGHTYDLTTGSELSLQKSAEDNPAYTQIINEEILRQKIERDLPINTSDRSPNEDLQYVLRRDELFMFEPIMNGLREFAVPLKLLIN